ncbi:MAG: hypothetical protein ACLQAH_15645 [Limisphaerales bacterium]
MKKQNEAVGGLVGLSQFLTASKSTLRVVRAEMEPQNLEHGEPEKFITIWELTSGSMGAECRIGHGYLSNQTGQQKHDCPTACLWRKSWKKHTRIVGDCVDRLAACDLRLAL